MPASLKRGPAGGLRFFDGRSQPVDFRLVERNLAVQIRSHTPRSPTQACSSPSPELSGPEADAGHSDAIHRFGRPHRDPLIET
jgi:hypothetical protein